MNPLKQLELLTHQPKTFDTVDTKSHITEHSKTLLKLSKTIRQAFAKKLDFKDIKFLVKARDIHKIEKKKYIGISVFGYENKVTYPTMYQKNAVKINMLIYYL